MPASKQQNPWIPVINERESQRPKTLFHRLSSGIVNVLPPLHSVTSRNELKLSPSTTSNSSSTHTRKKTIFAEAEQLLSPHAEDKSLTQHTQPCPYDPDAYHSFASIEKRRCSLCGMRGPKIVLNEPCEACRTGGPDSHIPSGGTQVDHRRRYSAIDPRELAHLADSSSSITLGPRPVTPERAARRIGNPSRVAQLPPGIIRLPVPDVQHQNAVLETPPKPEYASGDSENDVGLFFSSHKTLSKRKSVSPKLHHVHGLPKSNNFPFVHEHEIPKHAVALSTGSASPLTDRSQTPQNPPTVIRSPTYSSTRHYGGGRSPVPAAEATALQPQITTVVVKKVQERGATAIDLYASPLDAVLADSQAYRTRSPPQDPPAHRSQPLPEMTDSSTTFGSQDTSSTRLGSIRLELKGGSSTPSDTSLPRLRGGSAHDCAPSNTFSFKLKRWFLTCHGPCPDDLDTDDDADLPPARAVTPVRVANMQQKMNGRAALPTHLSRRISLTSTTNNTRGAEALPAPTSLTTTISGPPPRRRSICLSPTIPALFGWWPESPINQPALLTPSQVLNPPFPHLRGGGDAALPLPADTNRIPPTLFWLAGGTGRKPGTFAGWKRTHPKRRSGGLFGMAVFGRRYGVDYEVETKREGEGGGMVECSASVEAAIDNVASAKGLQGDADGSSASALASSTVQTATGTADLAEDGAQDAVECAPTPFPTQVVDEVPLCSGALPVEPDKSQQGFRSADPEQAEYSEARDGAEAAKGGKS